MKGVYFRPKVAYVPDNGLYKGEVLLDFRKQPSPVSLIGSVAFLPFFIQDGGVYFDREGFNRVFGEIEQRRRIGEVICRELAIQIPDEVVPRSPSRKNRDTFLNYLGKHFFPVYFLNIADTAPEFAWGSFRMQINPEEVGVQRSLEQRCDIRVGRFRMDIRRPCPTKRNPLVQYHLLQSH